MVRRNKRTKQATLLYGDWFVLCGNRVRGPNFPLSADLCPHHRLDYASNRQTQKCPRAGFWGTGVPASEGDRRFLSSRYMPKNVHYLSIGHLLNLQQSPYLADTQPPNL